MDNSWIIGFKTTNYGTGQHQDDVGDRRRPTIGGFWTEGKEANVQKENLGGAMRQRRVWPSINSWTLNVTHITIAYNRQ